MTLDQQLAALEEQLAPYRAAEKQRKADEEKQRQIRALEAELSMFQRSAQHKQLKLPFGDE